MQVAPSRGDNPEVELIVDRRNQVSVAAPANSLIRSSSMSLPPPLIFDFDVLKQFHSFNFIFRTRSDPLRLQTAPLELQEL
jgi:hypothetical protein